MAISMVFIAFMIAISIISMLNFPKTEAGPSGFSIDLIHRDSPQSPSYDSSLVPSQRSINVLRRSFNRLNRFTTDYSTESTVTDIISDNGEYLMKFYLGTPPVPILAIFDTGSDLIWTQCQPCVKCFKQKYPIFNPSNSSTYRKLACGSSSCKAYPDATCGKNNKSCLYSQYYADGSYTNGNIVTETFTLGATKGRNISFSNAVIGCGVKNDGIFNAGESGIAGFGFGKVSLISQLGSSVKPRFSYCLVSDSSKASNSSKLYFGKMAVVSGLSTPMVLKSESTLYYLTLEGISLGNKRLDFFDTSIMANATKASKEGNMIIDSGTTLTFLHTDLYRKLLKALERTVKLRRVKDPLILLDLCYYSKKHIEVPVITVHFKGADVKLNSENTFIELKKNVYCLAFGPAVEVGLFGNLAQRNFLVGYDLIKKTVSFKPTNCSKS